MAELILATGRHMPRDAPENELLAAALAELGITAAVRPWDEPLDWADARLVLVRTTWDYYTRLDDFLAWARRVDRRTALRNTAAILEWNSHKRYLLHLAEAGVPVIPTTLLPRNATAAGHAEALARHDGGEVVIKPAVSAGARGALRVRASEPAAAEHLAMLTRAGDALVQPFVPSVATAGESSLIFFGDRFSHAVRKVPAGGDYRVHEGYGGSVEPYRPSADEMNAARAALAAAPAPPTYARVDLVTGPDGPAVMELELIEPELFLPHHEGAAARYARHLAEVLRS